MATYHKVCEWCKKNFETNNSTVRFCGKSCSAKYRHNKFGVPPKSKKALEHLSQSMKKLWEREEFRKNNYKRMTENNPSMYPEIVAKQRNTRILKNSYTNNFKGHGNGHISDYEQKVMPFLLQLGFQYNYAISTKLARDTFPEKHYAKSYKPDFTNTLLKICIEVDGDTHLSKVQQSLDYKKDECLKFLGFVVYRFTHKQIDNLQLFEEEVNSIVDKAYKKTNV